MRVLQAGLVAAGETQVTDVLDIDRGYQNFSAKLNGLCADIVETAPPTD